MHSEGVETCEAISASVQLNEGLQAEVAGGAAEAIATMKEAGPQPAPSLPLVEAEVAAMVVAEVPVLDTTEPHWHIWQSYGSGRYVSV